VLLNAKGYAIPQLVEVFGIGRDAISAWLDAWAAQGLRGLQDEVRLGRPAVLTEGDLQELKILIDENPHQLKMAVAQFEDKSGKKAELITYRRAIKKF
jgi:transposase